MGVTTVITVAGMTCDHCIAAVRSEVSRLADVTGVDVDLATGRVTVMSDAPIDHAALAEAIDEAGYEVRR
jgi:copper chaperone